jgi:hypothetical protein
VCGSTFAVGERERGCRRQNDPWVSTFFFLTLKVICDVHIVYRGPPCIVSSGSGSLEHFYEFRYAWAVLRRLAHSSCIDMHYGNNK